MKHKKGFVDNLSGLVTGLGTIAIIIAVIFLVIAESRTFISDDAKYICGNVSDVYNTTSESCHRPDAPGTETGWSAAWNATGETQSAMSDIPGWLPIVVITVIGGILLLIVRVIRR